MGKGKEGFVHWYNPKTRVAETVPAPYADEEAEYMLSGDPDSSWAFVNRMDIEQAMIFVRHRFRMWHLRYLPVG